MGFPAQTSFQEPWRYEVGPRSSSLASPFSIPPRFVPPEYRPDPLRSRSAGTDMAREAPVVQLLEITPLSRRPVLQHPVDG